MAEDSGKSLFSTIPLPGLLAVISGIMGTVLLQYEPLKARRPVESAGPIVNAGNNYEIEASLYEDPLKVIERTDFKTPPITAQTQLPEATRPAVQNTEKKHSIHSPETLSNDIRDEILGKGRDRNPEAKNSLLIIPFYLTPGSESVNSESRAQRRLAVVEGLASCGYVPYGGKLECCRFPLSDKSNSGDVSKSNIDVPFEWFRYTNRIPHLQPELEGLPKTHAIVLWLRGDAFDESPVLTLRKILQSALHGKDTGIVGDRFETSLNEKVRVAAIGPYSTGALIKLVKEANQWKSLDTEIPDASAWKGRICMYSPFATASTDWVLSEAIGRDPTADGKECPELENIVKKSLDDQKNPEKEKVFIRTIATDNVVAAELVDELKLRGVRFGSGCAKQDGKIEVSAASNVAIISEFDTTYGRAFPSTFLHASGQEPQLGVFNANNSPWHWFNFPLGLDGRSVSDKLASNRGTSSGTADEKGKEKEYRPDEIPDGPNQADALRRMARQMEELDEKLKLQGKQGIRAIGLMGGDVYDKLWLLRALKPRFPKAIFFTDNLDAWLWQRDELRCTRNLVVASPFGLSLAQHYQMGKAPFRDNYQTSAYAATLAAAGSINPDALVSEPVRRYEISLDGPRELSVPWEKNDNQKKVHPTATDPWIKRDKIKRLFAFSMLIAILSSLLWSAPHLVSKLKQSGSTERRFRPRVLLAPVVYYLRMPLLWLPLVAYVSFIAMYELWLIQANEIPENKGEPFFLWKGISGWPTQGLRIASILIAGHLTLNILLLLARNGEEIGKRFFKVLPEAGRDLDDPMPEERGLPAKPVAILKSLLGRFAGLWLWRSEARTDASSGSPTIQPELLWREYSRYGSTAPRLVRALTLTLVFGLVLYVFSRFSGRPPSPLRGDFAMLWDRRLELWSNIAFLWIAALVIETMWTSRMFTHWVTRGDTVWDASQIQAYTSKGIASQPACDYLDLQLVAERTRPIAGFAFYPFYVLAPLAVSRSNYFDHWLWPASSILTCAVVILLVILAANLLRAEAEGIRTTAIARLRAARPFETSEKSSSTLLIREIKGIRTGTFAPFSEQPVMKAVYWLLSGLGITGLWQYFSQVM